MAFGRQSSAEETRLATDFFEETGAIRLVPITLQFQ